MTLMGAISMHMGGMAEGPAVSLIILSTESLTFNRAPERLKL